MGTTETVPEYWWKLGWLQVTCQTFWITVEMLNSRLTSVSVWGLSGLLEQSAGSERSNVASASAGL